MGVRSRDQLDFDPWIYMQSALDSPLHGRPSIEAVSFIQRASKAVECCQDIICHPLTVGGAVNGYAMNQLVPHCLCIRYGLQCALRYKGRELFVFGIKAGPD